MESFYPHNSEHKRVLGEKKNYKEIVTLTNMIWENAKSSVFWV